VSWVVDNRNGLVEVKITIEGRPRAESREPRIETKSEK
jgi:hypothetical protein